MTDKNELRRHLQEASSKILLVGDIHLMDKPPRNCTEAYTEDIFDILAFTAKLEQQLGLDAVVWAGDIFHHKQPSRTSHRLVLRAIEAVKRYKRLYIVTGNHDISNDRLDSVAEQQPLGVLFEAGATELDGWAPDLPIFGVPWQQRWNEDGAVEDAFADWHHEGHDIGSSLAVTHASIFPPGQEPIFDHILAADVAAAMDGAGSVYYGHIHDYHGTYEVDGVTFCNPGAVSRGSLTESNVTRGVRAALWTPENGFLEIDLPARPSSEIFRLEDAGVEKSKKISDERFLEGIGSTRLEISSTAGVIAHIQGLDDEVVPAAVKAVAIEVLELQDA